MLCTCENEQLYGDCTHDCDSWKANPDVVGRTGWDGLPVAFNEVED